MTAINTCKQRHLCGDWRLCTLLREDLTKNAAGAEAQRYAPIHDSSHNLIITIARASDSLSLRPLTDKNLSDGRVEAAIHLPSPGTARHKIASTSWTRYIPCTRMQGITWRRGCGARSLGVHWTADWLAANSRPALLFVGLFAHRLRQVSPAPGLGADMGGKFGRRVLHARKWQHPRSWSSIRLQTFLE